MQRLSRRLVLSALAVLPLAVTGCVSSEAPPPKPVVLTPEKAAGAPAAAVAKITAERCGATYTLDDGDLGGTGVFVVDVYPEPGRSEVIKGFPTAKDVMAFIDRNGDLIRSPGHAIGTWCEGDGGGDCHQPGKEPTCHLEISRPVPALAEATRLARACNQQAIAWLKYDGVKILDNGGKGYGDGTPLRGPALDVCRKARGD